MIRFITASYTDAEDATALARQIAKFTAASDNKSVLFTKGTLYQDIKEKDAELTVTDNKNDIPDDADILVSDYGIVSNTVINTSDADRIYLAVNAEETSAQELSKKLTAFDYSCTIVLYGTNDMSEYKEIGEKIIKVGRIRRDKCQYEIRMDLDLLSHQKEFNVPDPQEEFEYEEITEKAPDDEDEEPEKKSLKDMIPSLPNIGIFNKKNNDDEEEDSPVKDGPDKPEIIYEDDGNFKQKLLSMAGAAAGAAGTAAANLASSIKEKSEKKKEEKAEGKEQPYLQKESEVNTSEKIKPSKNDKKISEKTGEEKRRDWNVAASGVENRAKVSNRVISAINAVLIISCIILAINTFLAYRESMHKMVALSDIEKTEYPPKHETDGISVTNYSGIAKNQKYAVVIGDDSFVKPYSKRLESLKSKSAVETKKYEIIVSYSNNPVIQWAYGDLHFVHHSILGEGDFSRKEISEIVAYARKWYTKKRYDLFRFNDRDTINLSNPPDSLLRYVGKDD